MSTDPPHGELTPEPTKITTLGLVIISILIGILGLILVAGLYHLCSRNLRDRDDVESFSPFDNWTPTRLDPPHPTRPHIITRIFNSSRHAHREAMIAKAAELAMEIEQSGVEKGCDTKSDAVVPVNEVTAEQRVLEGFLSTLFNRFVIHSFPLQLLMLPIPNYPRQYPWSLQSPPNHTANHPSKRLNLLKLPKWARYQPLSSNRANLVQVFLLRPLAISLPRLLLLEFKCSSLPIPISKLDRTSNPSPY